LRPYDKRGQMLEIAGARVIDDCYNSNPKALISMVEALAQLKAKRHIVVAGEMLELGMEGERLHRQSGEQMAARGADILLGVRGLAREMVMAAKQAGVAAEFVSTPEEAGEWLARNVHSGDAVLLKASRGVKLEKALESWKNAVKSSVR
jgi:UDP-N-acetylmuramoyl-tripeptide--D-alanyl-D-alanine ligase